MSEGLRGSWEKKTAGGRGGGAASKPMLTAGRGSSQNIYTQRGLGFGATGMQESRNP